VRASAAQSYAHLGREAEAREAAARLLQLDPNFAISALIARGGFSFEGFGSVVAQWFTVTNVRRSVPLSVRPQDSGSSYMIFATWPEEIGGHRRQVLRGTVTTE